MELIRLFARKLFSDGQLSLGDFSGVFSSKLGINNNTNCLDLAEWSSTEVGRFVNEIYNASIKNDESKILSLLEVVSHNKDRALHQYWQIRQQTEFSNLFINKIASFVFFLGNVFVFFLFWFAGKWIFFGFAFWWLLFVVWRCFE